MKIFSSPEKFAEFLKKAALAEVLMLKQGLEVAAKLIQKEAKQEIGILQGAIGPFPAWPELADSTKRDKERKGYVLNQYYNPLLRTGHLRESIKYEINIANLQAIVGSNDPVASFQEFGTKHIPPRPFIGRAAFVVGPKIVKIFGNATMNGISGKVHIEKSFLT